MSTTRTFAFVIAMLAVAFAFGAMAQSKNVDGQVTKVDPGSGKITIRHGPMKEFDMSDGMTMVFRAQDPAMLKAVKPGDKVKFDVDRVQGQFTVTRIEKAKK
jgi:Cu(I)/Ag(I) efflux system protein CusF